MSASPKPRPIIDDGAVLVTRVSDLAAADGAGGGIRSPRRYHDPAASLSKRKNKDEKFKTFLPPVVNTQKYPKMIDFESIAPKAQFFWCFPLPPLVQRKVNNTGSEHPWGS